MPSASRCSPACWRSPSPAWSSPLCSTCCCNGAARIARARWRRRNEESEMIKTSLTAVALAALLSACGTLPEPATPAPDLPQRFAQAREGADVAPAAPDAIGDWAVFADPVLDALVWRAFEANLDLQQAAERVQRSRALAAGARAALAPGGGVGVDVRA